MSDIAIGTRLKPSLPQLPVSAYFDPAVFEKEIRILYGGGAQYVGHELQVPGVGDYQTIAAMEHRNMLVRNNNGVALLGNVCRHRQALMMEGRGRTRSVVCPAHHWTYDLEGNLLGAPEFAENPCLPLKNTPLHNWHGLLFAGQRDVHKDLADFPLAADYDFSGYVFERAIVEECPYNWKNFLEIFLELYHVVPIHPGLQKFVDPGNYKWGFGERWSYQIMGLKDELKFQHSQHYAKYRDAILAYAGGKLPKYGTVWSILYPNVMLEWYPFCLVVSYLVPQSPERTLNIVEFYYPEDIALFERTIVDAHQAAYAESAAEDTHVCHLLHKGRKALYDAGEEDIGPYQSPLEDGMVHFHEWWRKELGV
jgi:phenylpropionate dioxygenase-like ring-hydroxylating dioxygenase large terminal subunit